MAVLSQLEPAGVFRFFEEICSIPHGSGNVERISDYLKKFAKDRGLFCIQDELKNIIIKKNGSAGYEDKEPVIIQGHMDMVAVKKPDSDIDMKKDGLRLAVDGDFLFAEGTSLGGDDGIAVAYALALLDDDSLEHPPLEVIITVDEETGMDGAIGIDLDCIKGRRMLNLDSEEEGIFLFPVSQMVSDPLVSYLFSLIKEGRLGSIKEYSLSWSFPSPLKRWMSVWGNEAGIDEKSLFLLSASPVFDLVYSLFGDEEVTSYKEKEDRVEVIFNRGVLSISDGYGGFSFHIKGEKCEIAGKNGKLISTNGSEKIYGFETESIRTPFSPLASWYNSVYFALESGVWPKEKYMATLKGLKLITQCKKYFV